MRNLWIVLTLSTFVAVACARYNGPNSSPVGVAQETYEPGMTGAKSPESGLNYVDGGDARVGSTQFVTPSAPVETPKSTSPAPKANVAAPAPAPKKAELEEAPAPVPEPIASPAPLELKDRLKEFEISRFDESAVKFKRFGQKSYRLRLFFRDRKDPLVFEGRLNGAKDHFQIHDKSGTYSLMGKLDDLRDVTGDALPNKTTGEFDLFDSSTNQSAKIWYRAYEARLRVREDADKPVAPGSDAERQLKNLQDNTFGWSNNWSVEHKGAPGVSFFLVDIIKRVHADAPANSEDLPKIFSFKGESVQIKDDPQPDQSLSPEFTDVKTVGNAANEGLRLISAQIVDKQSNEKVEFALDLEEENPRSSAPNSGTATAPAEPSDDDIDWNEPVSNPTANTRSTPTRSTPSPSRRSGTTQSQAPAPVKPAVGNSYLPIDVSLPQTAKMHHDLSRDRNLPGVQKWIAKMQPSSVLREFYTYAYPFRDFLETLAQTYDVAPVFAYLPMNESHYFQRRHLYDNKQIGDSGLAFGPFQMHPDAAHDASVRTTGRSDDERFFYAPSACGAANLLSQKVRPFMKTDTTFAILAYNQGGAGAMNYARRFSYTYSLFSRAGAYSTQRAYVDKQVAIYLISADLAGHRLSLGSFVNGNKPRNSSVFPPSAIHDPTCRAVVQSAQL